MGKVQTAPRLVPVSFLVWLLSEIRFKSTFILNFYILGYPCGLPSFEQIYHSESSGAAFDLGCFRRKLLNSCIKWRRELIKWLRVNKYSRGKLLNNTFFQQQANMFPAHRWNKMNLIHNKMAVFYYLDIHTYSSPSWYIINCYGLQVPQVVSEVDHLTWPRNLKRFAADSRRLDLLLFGLQRSVDERRGRNIS